MNTELKTHPAENAAPLKLSREDLIKAVASAVKSQFGFHIIRLDDIREAQLPKLEEVKPQISQQLQQQSMATFQQEMRAKAKVE